MVEAEFKEEGLHIVAVEGLGERVDGLLELW
jgi:hypothetical protein